MELRELTEKTLSLLEIETTDEMSKRLLEVVKEGDAKIYEEFDNMVENNLSVDWMQKIFQYYQADRKGKMQDYTPASLARFCVMLTETENENSVYDLCAGSGALTIQKWNINHDLNFVCYEYDKNVIPFLLFNLAIRNINALVINGDALQGEVYTRYEVKRGERYSTVEEKTDVVLYETPQSCISNPPYNMKWKLPPFAQIQPRFYDCELPPESNANYAFILTALSFAKDKVSMILPNGVLTTNNAQEKEIRKYLIEKNLIDAVIACPDKMFEATNIPICIVVFNKHKTTANISFVDMRNTYKSVKREQNGQFGGASHENRTYKKEVKIFTDEQIQKAIDSILNQLEITEFSKPVSIKTIEENEYILTPSRYIEAEQLELKHREYADIVYDLNRVIEEKNKLRLTVNESLAKSIGLYDVFIMFKNSQEINENMNKMLKIIGKEIEKENFVYMSKKAGELKFENGSKDSISTILISILQMWKQHIMYLNNEENRYLAELRDALLPDLMSGKIDMTDIDQ